MRSIAWTYLRANLRTQGRDLTNNPATLILTIFGLLSIVSVSFLFGYSVRYPAWGKDVLPAILGTPRGLSLLLLSYCGFFAIVTFVLALIALFHPSQVQELERLRALPVSEHDLFRFKCGDILHTTTPLVFLVVLAAGAGLNLGGNASAGFIAVLLVLSVLLVHMVGWMMLALVLVAITLLPVRRVGRGALLFVLLAVGASGLLAFRGVDRARVLDALAGIGPTGWTAGLIQASRSGHWREAATLGAGVLAVAAALRMLAFAAYRSLYLRRLDPLLEKVWPDPHAGAGKGRLEALLLAPLTFCSPAARAVARKDLRAIRRDPIVGYAAYAGVALGFLGAGIAWWEAQTGEAEGVAWPFWGVVTLIVAGYLLNLNLSAFGREERGLETLRAMPVAPRQLLVAKGHVLFVLSLPVAAALLGVAWLGAREGGIPPAFWEEGTALGLLGAAAFAWTGATVGAVFPKYDSKSQFRAVTLVGMAVHAGLVVLFLASAFGAVEAVRAYGKAFLFVPLLVAAVWAGVLWFLASEAERALSALLGTRPRSPAGRWTPAR